MRQLGNEWQLPSRSVPISIQLTLFYFFPAQGRQYTLFMSDTACKPFQHIAWVRKTFDAEHAVQTGRAPLMRHISQLTAFSLDKSFVLLFTVYLRYLEYYAAEDSFSGAQHSFILALKIHQSSLWSFQFTSEGRRGVP